MTSVAFDLSILRHPEGGTARYARLLLGGMRAQQRASDRIIALDGLPRAPRRTVVRRFINAALDLAWLGPIATAASVVRRIDAWYGPASVLPFGAVGASVVTIHDLNPLLAPEAHDPRYAAWAGRMFRRSARRADRILADSEFTANAIREIFGVHGDRVLVAYPGLDHALATSPDRAHGIEGPYALFVGQTEVHKNVELLLEAWPSVPAPLLLVIAGPPGRADERLRELAARPSLRSRVLFAGPVSESRLAGLYAGARCFLFPSRLEGFGLPPLEAMAHGIPTAVADRASLPEVTRGAALIFDPDDPDALAALVGRLDRDEPVRQRLAEDGRRVSARYRWSDTAATAWNAVREAVD